MSLPIIFATNNAHKLQEVREILPAGFDLKSLDELHFYDDIAETGSTFEENAAIKSRIIYTAFSTTCFADDSGLQIEALNNEPGVYSARYSGSRDPQLNISLVLERMLGLDNRNAQFRTVISLIHAGREHLFEGTVSGTIRYERSGNTGFGYDPIFQPDGYTITFAEMSTEQKNKISHRGIAIRQMAEFLQHLH